MSTIMTVQVGNSTRMTITLTENCYLVSPPHYKSADNAAMNAEQEVIIFVNS